MVLGFKTTINRKPTNFKEQILKGSKIHTIRSGSRWAEGSKIHMVTGARTKLQKQFNEDRPDLSICTGAQRISIKWGPEEDALCIDKGGQWVCVRIWIDGVLRGPEEVELLAKNDGFLSLEDFLDWFNEDFEGQIVHWSGLKY